MRLNRFKIVNVFQHEHFEHELEGHLIGIIGANGSGKSNLLNAIRFGFGGDVPGKTRERILRWGATHGHVELEGVNNGEKYTLTRAAHASQAQFSCGKLDVSGVTKVNDAVVTSLGFDRDVLNTVFVAQAELDKILFDQASKRETAFLKMCGLGDTAKVHRDLGQLLAHEFPVLPDYDEQIAVGYQNHAQMEQQLTAVEQQVAGADAQLAGLPTVETIQANKVRLRDAQTAAHTANNLMPNIDRLSRSIATLIPAVDQLKQQTAGITLEQIDTRLQAAQAALQAAESYRTAQLAVQQHKGALAALTAPGQDETALDAEQTAVDALQGVLMAAQPRQNAEATLAQLEQALAELADQPYTEEYIQAGRDALGQRGAALQERAANANLYLRLLKSIESTTLEVTECPLCGSEITDLTALTLNLKTKLAEYGDVDADQRRLAADGQQLDKAIRALEAWHADHTRIQAQLEQARKTLADLPKVEGLDDISAEELATRRAALTAGRQALQTYELSRARIDGQLKQAEAMLASLPATDGDVDQLRTEVTGIQQIRGEMAQAFNTLTRLETQMATEQKQLDDQRASYDQAWTAVLTGEPTMADQAPNMAILKLAQLLQQWENQGLARQEAEKQLAALQATHTQLKSGLTTLEASIKELERRRAQQGDYRQLVQTLTNVRDWFHYGNGPHAVSTAIMTELTANLNGFLERLNVPFRALADDSDLGYRCPFVDGREMPPDGPPSAADLSGGQKMMLAIAFRFASYCMFANKQGILSLDEPTVYLDAENVGNFCNLLERMREVAQSLDLQLFISTHERSVIPFMDTVIDLTKQEDNERDTDPETA